MPDLPAPEPSLTDPIDPTYLTVSLNRARELLLRAGLIVSAYRAQVERAGYPFREPSGVLALQIEIDAYLFPPAKK